MSKPKDEVAEMQKQCDAALASLVASWVGTEKELKDFYATNYMGVTGMTLRDYFAGQAMNGIITESFARDASLYVASMAYEIADEMIVERNREAAK